MKTMYIITIEDGCAGKPAKALDALDFKTRTSRKISSLKTIVKVRAFCSWSGFWVFGQQELPLFVETLLESGSPVGCLGNCYDLAGSALIRAQRRSESLNQPLLLGGYLDIWTGGTVVPIRVFLKGTSRTSFEVRLGLAEVLSTAPNSGAWRGQRHGEWGRSGSGNHGSNTLKWVPGIGPYLPSGMIVSIISKFNPSGLCKKPSAVPLFWGCPKS